MNILHIIGFLGADPEARFTPSGQKLWSLRVATRSYKNGQEETIWWRITAWGEQWDKLLAHFKKGKPIYVIAEMNKLDVYTDKTGQQQVAYDATARSLHFVPSSDNRQDQEGATQYGGNKGAQPQYDATPARQQPSSYGEESFGGQAKQQGMSNDYASAGAYGGNNFAGGAAVRGNAPSHDSFTSDDDQLPF